MLVVEVYNGSNYPSWRLERTSSQTKDWGPAGRPRRPS